MGKYASVLGNVKNAESMGGFAPKPPLGKHKVALTKFVCRESKQEKGNIMEAEYVVLESSVPGLVGSKRSTAWFLDSDGQGKKYERDRANKFILMAIECFPDAGDQAALAEMIKAVEPNAQGIDAQVFGELMLDESQPLTGLLFWVEVTESFNKKKERTYENAGFTAIPQSLAAVFALAPTLANIVPAASHPNAPGQGAAPHAAAPTPTPAPKPAIATPTPAPAPAPSPTPAAAGNPLAAALARMRQGG